MERVYEAHQDWCAWRIPEVGFPCNCKTADRKILEGMSKRELIYEIFELRKTLQAVRWDNEDAQAYNQDLRSKLDAIREVL